MKDLRQYAHQTNIQLMVGGLLVLFIIGDGLIYLFYGTGAAISGIICMGVGLIPLALIFLALWIIDWIAKHAGSN